MDAKPMTPAEIAALVRRLRNALLYESSGDGSALPEEAADCIDAQAAEITALRAAVKYMTDEALRLRAERDALAARLAVPAEEELAELDEWLRAGVPSLGFDDDLASETFDVEGGSDAMLAAADALTALRARVAGLEGALRTKSRLAERFGSDDLALKAIIASAGELPRFNPGPFRDGFRTAIEELGARVDLGHDDGNHQMQDLAEQIISLVSGESYLIDKDDFADLAARAALSPSAQEARDAG